MFAKLILDQMSVEIFIKKVPGITRDHLLKGFLMGLGKKVFTF